MIPMFAHMKDDGSYYHVYGSEVQVKMCGQGHIHPVWIEEVTENETHWGWKKLNGKISMIWESVLQLQMCFPYGMKVEVEAGRGAPVGLRVTAREKTKYGG